MTLPETMNLFQRAVLWKKTGVDGYGVVIVARDPIEIACRWNIVETKSGGGDTDVSSQTSSLVVDQEIEIGSVIWVGDLSLLPDPVSNLLQVIDVTNVPDIKGRKFYRTVRVQRFTNSLPQTSVDDG